ncbi:MAG: TatD family hydrolase [Candidatus Marinimicrobia bacterium]|nr:TatD family hydrolase [Candidatus Neomarinimicrobiota bacterium]
MLIDTHAHISYKDYSDRIDEVIQVAENNGVEKIISIGVDLPSSEECLKLAEKYPAVYATCGIHPHEADKAPKGYLYELEAFTQHPKVVAVGEMGLDYHYDFSDRKVQRRVYHEQLEMSKSLELPAVVHCRESDDDILEGIQNSGLNRGVIHCFASDVEFAENILETGFHISFTGMITFVKELENVVKEVPLERMMIETDSPYLSPKPYRGKQNEPKNVLHVAEKIAELKEISLEEVMESTTETALNLFNKIM